MGQESRRRRQQAARTEARRELQELQASPTRIVENMIQVSRTVSGPIPPAEQLAAYREIDPGLPARIVSWAEEESAHRRLLERKAVEAEIAGADDLRRINKRSQIFGLTLGLSAIAGGVGIVWLACGNAGAIGGSLFSSVGLVSPIWGPRQRPAALPMDPSNRQPRPPGDR